MDKKVKIKRLVIVAGIVLLAVTLFIGGMALTNRYKTTIVSTYDKYYNQYHDEVESYANDIDKEIQKNIQLASQEDEE